MNEELSAVGRRLIALRAKLAARDGQAEYKDNVKALRTEIARLEQTTIKSPEGDDGSAKVTQ